VAQTDSVTLCCFPPKEMVKVGSSYDSQPRVLYSVGKTPKRGGRDGAGLEAVKGTMRVTTVRLRLSWGVPSMF
jgi:hypothetical protein